MNTKAQDTDAQSGGHYFDLGRRLRRHHDDLNCTVDSSGTHFKSQAALNEEVESAMKDCWDAADALQSLTEENERLKRRVGELEAEVIREINGSNLNLRDAERYKRERDEARAALERLASMHAFTTPFKRRDNNEGRELLARMKFADDTLTQNTEGESDG